MISKTYLRYIWLIDTIDKSRIPLDFEHIVKLWQASPYAYMGGLSIRTFHEHRKGIKEMFDIDIACDKSSLFTYYIKNPEVLKRILTHKCYCVSIVFHKISQPLA